MGEATIPGFVAVRSQHSVDDTVARVVEALSAKAVKVFAVVDHSGEAASVGLEMRPTKLVIFGNPKAGTPVMVATPSAAIDLPLKLLVWEDAEAQVWIAYNSVEYLRERHGFPEEYGVNLAVVETLAKSVAGA